MAGGAWGSFGHRPHAAPNLDDIHVAHRGDRSGTGWPSLVEEDEVQVAGWRLACDHRSLLIRYRSFMTVTLVGLWVIPIGISAWMNFWRCHE